MSMAFMSMDNMMTSADKATYITKDDGLSMVTEAAAWSPFMDVDRVKELRDVRVWNGDIFLINFSNFVTPQTKSTIDVRDPHHC